MNLKCGECGNGIMAYWEGVEEAYSYKVILYIDDKDVETVYVDRLKKRHAFTDLVYGLEYHVSVSAMDKADNIIEQSCMTRYWLTNCTINTDV